MKYAHKLLSALILFATATLLNGCSEKVEPFLAVGIVVEDDEGVPISGAEVDIYASPEDFRNDVNPIASGVSEENGLVAIPYEEATMEAIRFRPVYVSVQRGELNNWTDQIVQRLEVNGDIPTITIRQTINTRLAGRNQRTWHVVRYIIDGREVSNCSTLLSYTFDLNGNIQINRTPECGGRFVRNDIWEGLDLNSFQTFSEARVIQNYTGTSMRMLYSLGGNFSVIEDFELVEE